MLFLVFLCAFPAFGTDEHHPQGEDEVRGTEFEIELEDAVVFEEETVFRERFIVDHPLTKRLLLGLHTVFEESPFSEGEEMIEGHALIGPTMILGRHGFAKANVSAGIGTGEEPLLFAGSFIYDQEERPYVYAFLEYGGREVWFKGLLTYKIVDHLALGAHVQSKDGAGLQASLHANHFELWATPMYEWEAGNIHLLSGITWRP